MNAETTLSYPADGQALLVSTGTKLANVGVVIIDQEGNASARSTPLESLTLEGAADVAGPAAAIQQETTKITAKSSPPLRSPWTAKRPRSAPARPTWAT